MADLTNITDFDPATGRTTTTLVSTHDRGAQDEARRDGGQHATWHRTDQAPPGPKPTLASASPASLSAAAGPTVVTLTGTNFVTGAKVLVKGSAVTTTFISATQVSFSYDPTTAGTVQLAVRNPDGQQSPNLAFNVTALADEPAAATVEQIQEYVNAHPTEADAILAAEQARGGDARTTLVSWLETFIANRGA